MKKQSPFIIAGIVMLGVVMRAPLRPCHPSSQILRLVWVWKLVRLGF